MEPMPPIDPLVSFLLAIAVGLGWVLALVGLAVLLAGLAIPVLVPPGRDPADRSARSVEDGPTGVER